MANRPWNPVRASNGASTIYKGKDGWWHGRVTIGVTDEGKEDRRHVSARTQAEARKKVRELERRRDVGTIQKVNTDWLVSEWLDYWVENIAGPFVKENTLAGYRVAVRVHLKPGIGLHRLPKLQPEHIEALYVRMMANGKAPATAHQAHRTLRAALNEAVRRGYIVRNPAALARAPRLVEHEVEPYTVDEVQRILNTALSRRNGARWAIALALGLRQGESLGLLWSDIDLDNARLTVKRQRLRPKWSHGCGGMCGMKHGGYCPQRVPARPETDDTKSRAGRRAIGLPEPLVALLKRHQVEQAQERLEAGSLWTEGGWVFTTLTGEPIAPRTDYDEWKRLLIAARVRDSRLHDARHTAATVLLLLGVPERAVMGLMGWSNTAMAARYQHLTHTIYRDVAARVGALLWNDSKTTTISTGHLDGDHDGAN